MCAAPDAGAPSPWTATIRLFGGTSQSEDSGGEDELKKLDLPAGRRSFASITLSGCGRRLLQGRSLFAELLLPRSASSAKHVAERQRWCPHDIHCDQAFEPTRLLPDSQPYSGTINNRPNVAAVRRARLR